MALVMWAWTASAQAQVPSVFTVVFATSGDGFLNVRDQPSMKGQVVEKLWMLMHGLGNGVLVESGPKWSKVRVNGVTGWVYNKYGTTVMAQPNSWLPSTICLSIVTIMWTKRICYSSRQ